jgi:septum formation protein
MQQVKRDVICGTIPFLYCPEHPNAICAPGSIAIIPDIPAYRTLKLPRITLASSSPRRRQLLRQIGVEHDVIPPDTDESILPGEEPVALVRRLSLVKAQSVASTLSDGLVLGSDTIVVLEGEILNKPLDTAEAFAMLRRLSGRTHTVYTGYAVVDAASGRHINSYETADVTFRELDDEEIIDYIATGSPLDKAGAYGIQDDYGAVFIERICGDYYSVVGLPIARVYQALREMSTGVNS